MQATGGEPSGRWLDAATVGRLVPGDVLAILAFVVAGEFSHGIDPIQAPLYVAETAAPFFVGWAVVGPLAGAYASNLLDSPRRTFVRTALGWLGADVVAQALRGTAFFHGGADPTFFMVAGVVGGTLLVLVRFVAVVLTREAE